MQGPSSSQFEFIVGELRRHYATTADLSRMETRLTYRMVMAVMACAGASAGIVAVDHRGFVGCVISLHNPYAITLMIDMHVG